MSGLFHRRCLVLVWLSLLAFLAPATAGRAADDNQIIVPGGSSKDGAAAAPGSASLNSVTLIVGLALAGVGGWLVWRNRRGVPVKSDLRSLAVEETRSLGNRQFLVVASYEGKKFLLGVCPGRINLLSALPQDKDDDEDGEL